MKVDAVLQTKNAPEWAYGVPITIDGKILIIISGSKVLWPRWWHRLGQKLGWRWLQKLGGLD